MAIIKIVVFTIGITFGLSEFIQAQPQSDFNLTQYLGKWHQVGLLFPETPKNGILCEWFTVEEHNCRGCFGEKYGELLTGEVRPKLFGTGLFEWPKIIVAYRDYFDAAFTYFLTCYNNNNDLILRDKNNLKYSKMLSRNTTVSSEARKAFESMAESAGLQAVFVDPTKCVT